MIRILIADDHAVVRDGLRHILERAGGFEVVAEAVNGYEVVKMAREYSAEVILLDLSMPGGNGLDLIRQLREEHPALRVLVLTMHADEQYVMRAFGSGASGYLTKESAAMELVNATSKVAGGGTYMSQAIAEKLATCLRQGEEASHPRLSEREMEEPMRR
ncbi:DNA-binding response regulator (plasmid) [Cupriavidus sp. USMAHM13]|nr:DNA-binding response regulator [Cupriavidus sp. USMAHM13]